MRLADLIPVVIIIALCIVAAVLWCHANKKGPCSGCKGDCAACSKMKKKVHKVQ